MRDARREPLSAVNAPEPASLRLTEFSHGGGCGCKIAPALLREIIGEGRAVGRCPRTCWSASRPPTTPRSGSINERQAIVATTDFFMPIVDDPVRFRRDRRDQRDLRHLRDGRHAAVRARARRHADRQASRSTTIRRILDGGEAVCAARRHSDRGRPHDRFGRADLRARRDRSRRSGEPEAQRRRAARRRARARQAARRRHLQRGAQEAAALRGALRGDDRERDAAQHAGHRRSARWSRCTR